MQGPPRLKLPEAAAVPDWVQGLTLLRVGLRPGAFNSHSSATAFSSGTCSVLLSLEQEAPLAQAATIPEGGDEGCGMAGAKGMSFPGS